MLALALVREATSRTITPRDKPSFTVYELVVEMREPLEIVNVRIPRDYEGQMEKFKELAGQDCLVPVARNSYGDYALTGEPRPARASAPKAAATA